MKYSLMIQNIGSFIWFAIVPVSLLVSSFVTQKQHSEMTLLQKDLAIQLDGLVNQEQIEAEVFSSFFANVIIADIRGKIISATPSATTMFGYKGNELRGKHINDLMPDRFKGSHNQQYARRANEPYDSKKIVTVPQCYGLKKDKTEFSIEVRTRAIKPNNGDLYLIAKFTETKDIEVVPVTDKD